ncbi:unnamed protein product [Allacma fusca]|uniref:Uncharacterized protein n=1 Tax=Allacma fusca TaxID=39272 RepID=A0A8J2LKP2_9HEXA|nr:unnamed protein product [Allacma fusca]
MNPFPDVLPEMPVSKNSPYYNMDHPDRGRAVIFNFDEWVDTSNNRAGSAKDKNDLAKCLEDLDFDVLTKDNLDTHEFWKILREVRDEDHRSRDCLVVAIMSHGEKNHILLRDETLVPLSLILEVFQTDKCPTLAGKPKIFIIQACRGKGCDTGTRLYSKEFVSNPCQMDVTDSGAFCYLNPNSADSFVAFSCPPGQRAFRNRYNGSWFIQAICKIFKEEAYNEDIQALFTNVAREVALNNQSSTFDVETETDKKVQVPVSKSTLIRKVMFRPKRIIPLQPKIDQVIDSFENIIGNNKQLLPPPSTVVEVNNHYCLDNPVPKIKKNCQLM